mmetsp:Transcript_90611/g.142151  ORF Transcript_90611/g.142151 Transcript_90611/m.142151 type:complete len:501 (-) Transcript_90611:24-1526(-)
MEGVTVADSGQQVRDRHYGEVSMESFIRHHMIVILQPLSEQVQDLEERFNRLAEGVHRSDADAADMLRRLDDNICETSKLQDGLGLANVNLSKARQALGEASERDEMLQTGLELANGFAQRLHNKLELCAGAVPDLQKGLNEIECQMQGLRANVQRTSDTVVIDMQGSLDRMSSELQDMQASHLTERADVGQLRSGLDENSKHLQDMRELFQNVSSRDASLQRGFDELLSRENQMSARVNDWKTQWSKLQPKLEAVTKDTGHLKQLIEHHEGTICRLQQGYATSFSSIEALQKQQVQLGFHVQSLQDSLSGAQRDSNDTREGLCRAKQFSNTLQGGLQKTENEVRRICLKVDGLETKIGNLFNTFEKTNGCVAELSKEHRRSVNSVQSLKLELEKTNENLSCARGQMEATENHLNGLKGEFGRTSEVIQRLDQGVELCQASFVGLQRGFVETGTHISRRPSALPKLTKVERPDSATESTRSDVSRRSSLAHDFEGHLLQK